MMVFIFDSSTVAEMRDAGGKRLLHPPSYKGGRDITVERLNMNGRKIEYER